MKQVAPENFVLRKYEKEVEYSIANLIEIVKSFVAISAFAVVF